MVFWYFRQIRQRFFLIFEVNGRIRTVRVFILFSFNSFNSFADVISESLFRCRAVSSTSFGVSLVIMKPASFSCASLASAFDVTGCSPFGKLVGIGSLPRVASCSPKFVSHAIVYVILRINNFLIRM